MSFDFLCPGEVLFGLGRVASLFVDAGAALIRLGAFLVRFERGVGVGNCRVEIALFQLHACAMPVARRWGIAIQPDRLGEIGRGRVQVAVFLVGDAAPQIAHEVVSIEPDGFGQVGDGLRRVAFSLIKGSPRSIYVDRHLGSSFTASFKSAMARSQSPFLA